MAWEMRFRGEWRIWLKIISGSSMYFSARNKLEHANWQVVLLNPQLSSLSAYQFILGLILSQNRHALKKLETLRFHLCTSLPPCHLNQPPTTGLPGGRVPWLQVAVQKDGRQGQNGDPQIPQVACSGGAAYSRWAGMANSKPEWFQVSYVKPREHIDLSSLQWSFRFDDSFTKVLSSPS